MAGITQVSYSINKREFRFPVSGAGADIAPGTILMKGATGGTNFGVAIPVTAASNAHAVGMLKDLHDFSVSGDATTASTLVYWWPEFTGSQATSPTHNLELLSPTVVFRIPYDLTSTVAVASASGATITITSFEANYDGGFVYVNAGVGIGQLEFAQSSTSGSLVLGTSPTVAFTSTSKLTKIMPMFLDTPVWKVATATNPNKLDSTAATGTGRAVCLGSYIVRNGLVQRLDPKGHNDLQSLNSLSNLEFFSEMAIVDSMFTPVA